MTSPLPLDDPSLVAAETVAMQLGVEPTTGLSDEEAARRLEAVGAVLKSGRTPTVCRLDDFALTDDERELVAAGQQTLISVPLPVTESHMPRATRAASTEILTQPTI